MHRAGTNPQEYKQLETEQEAWPTIDAMTGGLREKLHNQMRLNDKKDKALDDKAKQNADLMQQLAGLIHRPDQK